MNAPAQMVRYSLPVTSLQCSAVFYHALGFRLISRSRTSAVMRSADDTIELTLQRTQRLPLKLTVRDRHAALETVRTQKAQPWTLGLKDFAVATDPDGNAIEFHRADDHDEFDDGDAEPKAAA